MVLGLIHGLIGVVHQGLGVGAVIRIEGDPMLPEMRSACCSSWKG